MPFKNLEHDGEIVSNREITKVEKRKISEANDEKQQQELDKLQEEYLHPSNPALWTGNLDD